MFLLNMNEQSRAAAGSHLVTMRESARNSEKRAGSFIQPLPKPDLWVPQGGSLLCGTVWEEFFIP
jgi:hypothetical protein